jgi:formylglycine-generating enzyme required for sulfatase activity
LFVDADGYEREEFWTQAGRDWRQGRAGAEAVPDWLRDEYGREKFPITRPKDYQPVFQTPNHPRVGASWFEARAYAAWLNSPEVRPHLARDLGLPEDGTMIRLPAEAEWELAARWNTDLGEADERLYPWRGAETDAELTQRCNCHQTRIGSTSAVGLFSNGNADCGAADVSGNVWEWCENWYDKNTKQSRVLRGGAWVFDIPALLSCSCRFSLGPGLRDQVFGFRCVLVGVGSAPRWRHRTMGAMPDGQPACPARAKRSPNRPPHAPEQPGKRRGAGPGR